MAAGSALVADRVEVMTAAGSVRRWWFDHPVFGDVAPALIVLVIVALPLVTDAPDSTLAMSPGEFAVTVVPACVFLVFRRIRPWLVWGAVNVCGLVAVAFTQGPTVAYLPAIVAMFSLSVRVPSRGALAAAVAAALAPASVIIVASGDLFDAQAFFMTAWSGVALFAGAARRNQLEVLKAAQERAHQAEATREEEAQRRVAEERLRIARELHDVVAHHVSVINVQAGVAAHLVRRDPDATAEAIGHIREASQTVLREVPSLLGLLRTGESEPLETAPTPSLADADSLVEHARRNGMRVTWQVVGGPLEQLPSSIDLVAYRVLREALTNAGRHGLGECRVRIEIGDQQLRLEVRNPIGRRVEPTPGRHGLVGMHERVAAIGGTLETGAHPSLDGPSQWVVTAVLPFPANDTTNQNRHADREGSRR